MGILLTTNSQGVNNINAYITQSVGDERFKALGGLFGNIDLNGAPLIRGVFGDILISGNCLGINYAQVAADGFYLQKNLRLNVFKDEFESIDVNIFHNETHLGNILQFANFGGKLIWSYVKGHAIAFGFSHMDFFNTTAMEASFKANIWKSEKGSCSLDITSNIAYFVRGPLEGHQDLNTSLTFSYAF